MSTITVPKKEYTQLVEKALRYDYLKGIMEEDLFAPPSAKSVKKILAELKAQKKYNPAFLKSLERGLLRSSNVEFSRG